MQYELIATATFGLEAVVKREVEKLGYEVLAVEDGKVTYAGDKRAIVRSNLWLRTADRVLLKMAEFPAETFDELFEGTKAVAWEKLIPADGKFVVTGTSVKSKLHSVPACQKIVKKAMATRLCEAYGLSVMPEMGADYTVKITLLKDKMKEGGALTAMMSGSGPSVFGIFDSEEKAQAVYEQLRAQTDGTQVYLTKPFFPALKEPV